MSEASEGILADARRDLAIDKCTGGKWQEALWKKIYKHMLESDMLPFPLYHGTGTYARSLSAEERAQLLTSCRIVREYLTPILEKHQVTDGIPRSYAALLAMRIKEKSEMFKYDSLYLTSSLYRAYNYGKEGPYCGEQFHVAETLDTEMTEAGIPYPPASEEQRAALEQIRTIASLPSEPVVICFPHLRRDDVQSMENGTPVEWEKIFNSYVNRDDQRSFRMREGISLRDGIRIDKDKVEEYREAMEAERIAMIVDVARKELPGILRELVLESEPNPSLADFSAEELSAACERVAARNIDRIKEDKVWF